MNFAKAIRARHKAWFDDIGISEYVPLRINEDGLEMMVKAISPHLQSGYTCTGWTNGLGFLIIHRVGAKFNRREMELVAQLELFAWEDVPILIVLGLIREMKYQAHQRIILQAMSLI